MPAPQALPNLKHSAANVKPSSRSREVFSRRSRSEITLFTIIALLVFIIGSILGQEGLLELVLQYQAYHVDDIIVAVFLVSFVLIFFLLRGWQDVRREASEREVLV